MSQAASLTTINLLGPFDSLRTYMAALEAHGGVLRIPEIDQDAYEATALMYRLIDKYGWTGAPAVIFDRIKIDGEWMDGPVIANQYGRWNTEAIALGIEQITDDQPAMYRAAVEKVIAMANKDGQWKTIEPVEINRDRAPCKEVILTGDEIDLLEFPWLQSNPADAGRYINTGNVITYDPEHGRNSGTYRCQLKGPRKIGVNPEINQHGWTFLMDMKERGEPFARAAIVIGADPITYAMGSSKTARLGQDELAIAGGFMGRPLEVVKCETSELLVPANVEMVIEGEIPFDMEEEGPFGEMYGYMGQKKSENFYLNVTAVTHRENPWFVNQFTGVTRGYLTSPMEATANLTFKKVIPNLVGIHVPVEITGFAFLSIDKQKPGEAFEAAEPLTKFLNIAKIIVVVDKDVDILNVKEVMHAVGARWQPHPATRIIEQSSAMRLDPSIRAEQKSELKVIGSKIIIDATRQRPEEGGPEVYQRLNRACLLEKFPDVFDRIDRKLPEYLKSWEI
jgi:UbiD family decarboxylase